MSEPAVDIPDEKVMRFLRISEVLLDLRNLPVAAARAYLRIILDATPKLYAPGDLYLRKLQDSRDPHPFDVLWDVLCQLKEESLDDLESRFVAVLAADVTLSTMSKNIIILWYNGYLGLSMPPAEIYPEALVWGAIRANPPGVPGPYYGHWAYPPSDPILPSGGGDSES